MHPQDQLQNDSDQAAIDSIRGLLSALRGPIRALTQLLHIQTHGEKQQIDPKFHHMEFHLIQAIGRGLTAQALSDSIALMDQIDELRNSILKTLNNLLRVSKLKLLPYITLSSCQLKLSPELEQDGGRGSQRWDDYSLRMHERISAHLEGAAKSPSAKSPNGA